MKIKLSQLRKLIREQTPDEELSQSGESGFTPSQEAAMGFINNVMGSAPSQDQVQGLDPELQDYARLKGVSADELRSHVKQMLPASGGHPHFQQDAASGAVSSTDGRKVYGETVMKITEGELRSLIREAIGATKGTIGGIAATTGRPFIDIIMDALAAGDTDTATQAILDSYMMDDTWQQEEDALEEQLAALPTGASKEEVEAVADQWRTDYRSGKFRPTPDQYKSQWAAGSERARSRYSRK